MSDSNVTADNSLVPVYGADCSSAVVPEEDEVSAEKTSELSSGHNATANRMELVSLSFDRGMRIVTGRLRGGMPWGISLHGWEVPDQGVGQSLCYARNGRSNQLRALGWVAWRVWRN
jgi:hypothetical protein